MLLCLEVIDVRIIRYLNYILLFVVWFILLGINVLYINAFIVLNFKIFFNINGVIISVEYLLMEILIFFDLFISWGSVC